jgi:hypothetical protein
MDEIVHRGITAATLAWLGAFVTWAACGLLLQLGGAKLPEPWGSVIAYHGYPILVFGAYAAATAPYGWFVAGHWLAPATSGMTPFARALTLRTVIPGTLAIGPFVAPIGIAHDVQRFRTLRRVRCEAKQKSALDRDVFVRAQPPMKQVQPIPTTDPEKPPGGNGASG